MLPKPPLLAVLLACLLCVPRPAAAAAPMPSAGARAEASMHYDKGKEAAGRAKRFDAEGEVDFARVEYAKAAQEFDAAYQLVHDANALWGACRAYQLAGDLPTALKRYTEYMSFPNLAPAERADAKTRVDEITTVLIQRSTPDKNADAPAPVPAKTAPVAKVEPPAQPPASKPPGPDLAKGTHGTPPTKPSAAPPKDSGNDFGAWPWVVLTGGLAAGAAGVVVYLDGQSDWDASSNGTLDFDAAVAAQDSGTFKNQLGTGLMIGGGALVATSIILFALDGGGDEQAPRSKVSFAPVIDRNNAGMAITGTF